MLKLNDTKYNVAPYDVQVRAWDLGGFGDIAGAMRTASHLQRGGLETVIFPTSEGALRKLEILSPDVHVSHRRSSAMQVDVAGHYYDYRTNQDPAQVPHVFAEDMDNPTDRGDIVPIYIKTGLLPVGRQVGIELGGSSQNPMFYRPFKEWELPEPGKRDVKSLLMQAAGDKNPAGLQEILEKTGNIAFGHFKPYITTEEFLNSPYMQSLEAAAANFDGYFALGLFFNSAMEAQTAKLAVSRGYNVFTSYGEAIKGDPKKPTLIFLGPQPQMTTSSLFASSTIPNIVTGDLSLSDALYALIAMEGQGFFYDCPSWKKPTFRELARVLSITDAHTAYVFQNGSMLDYSPKQSDVEAVAERLGNRNMAERYRAEMRDKVLAEIKRRFGFVHINIGKDGQGLYVPRGAPFLFQDAVEAVLHTLSNSPELLSEVEAKRSHLAAGIREPVVAIAGNVMAPQAPMDLKLICPSNSNFIKYENSMDIIDNPKNLMEIKIKNNFSTIIPYHEPNKESKLYDLIKIPESFL